MNKVAFISKKTRKLFGPKNFAGLFSNVIFSRKVFLNRKSSVQCRRFLAAFSRRLPHNNPNSKAKNHSTICLDFF